jgi:hypothetical protein
MSWKLANPVQCKNCPWRKDADLNKIPDYCPIKHRNLKSTIQDNKLQSIEDFEAALSKKARVMLCHNATTQEIKDACVGWIRNQLENNNIQLRLAMRKCENASEIRVIGEQYPNFEDTLPENRY